MKCKQIIVESLSTFNNQNLKHFQHDQTIRVERMNQDNYSQYTEYFELNDEIDRIVTKCNAMIDEHLMRWNGVQLSSKSRLLSESGDRAYPHFRDYFKVAKNTFDQRKLKIVADNFWIALIQIVQQVMSFRVSIIYILFIYLYFTLTDITYFCR